MTKKNEMKMQTENAPIELPTKPVPIHQSQRTDKINYTASSQSAIDDIFMEALQANTQILADKYLRRPLRRASVPDDRKKWNLNRRKGERRDTNNEKNTTSHERVGPGEINLRVLGVSTSDLNSRRYILSQSIMENIRSHMPFTIQQDNFLLKYSLTRDGASMATLLSKSYHSPRTVLAIETISGDVFGAFTSSPWLNNGNQYYGSGESFLWKIKRANDSTKENKIDNLEVFPWAGTNRNIQLANTKKLVLGGDEPESAENNDYGQETKFWGFGITLSDNLSRGSSNCCMTYKSPSLLNDSENGEFFEVSNVELWSLTHMESIEHAERLEHARSFFFQQTNYAQY